MPENLLSLFPLEAGTGAYVRLTCLDFSNNGSAWASRCLMQRAELESALAGIDLPSSVEEILASLEDGVPVQLTVMDKSARKLDFSGTSVLWSRRSPA